MAADPAHLTDHPIQLTTAWAIPVPWTPAPTCVALLASCIVQVATLRARPVVRVAMNPLAELARTKAVVPAVRTVIVPSTPLLHQGPASATAGHRAPQNVLAVQIRTLWARPGLLIVRLWTR